MQIDIDEFRVYLWKKYNPVKAADIIRAYKTLMRHFKELPSEEEIDQKFKTIALRNRYKRVLKEIEEYLRSPVV